MCQLTGHKQATRIASKFTVYKWLWEHFPGNFCQQSCQQGAAKAPANRPQIKNKNVDKEQQLKVYKPCQVLSTEDPPAQAAAAFPRLIGKAKKLLNALPDEKREAAIALYYTRCKTQPIENPDAWFIKCIEEDWLHEEKLEIPNPKEEVSDFEKNRAYASELVRKIEGLPSLHICLRRDLLELGDMNHAPGKFCFVNLLKRLSSRLRLC